MQNSFRFLDLPAELRCSVYEHVQISSLRHGLTRSEADLDREVWPKMGSGAVEESSMTLITPETSIALLWTCRLIYREAHSIFVAKIQDAKSQPLRFIFDFYAASALLERTGILTKLVNNFVAKCRNLPP
jgi:hypothetical protein